MSQEDIIQEIIHERLRQDAMWGVDRNLHPFTWLIILGEEYGEACKGSLQAASLHGVASTSENWQNYRDELIQVAAAALAAIESFDRDQWREGADRYEGGR